MNTVSLPEQSPSSCPTASWVERNRGQANSSMDTARKAAFDFCPCSRRSDARRIPLCAASETRQQAPPSLVSQARPHKSAACCCTRARGRPSMILSHNLNRGRATAVLPNRRQTQGYDGPFPSFFCDGPRVKSMSVQCINKTRTSHGHSIGHAQIQVAPLVHHFVRSRCVTTGGRALHEGSATSKRTPMRQRRTRSHHPTFQAHSTLRRRIGGSGLAFASANKRKNVDASPRPAQPVALSPRPTTSG